MKQGVWNSDPTAPKTIGGAQNNMSLEQTVDAQIPLVSEHLTNLQLMRLNLQAKATIPEAERLQLEQEQKELRLKELELDQLWALFAVFL